MQDKFEIVIFLKKKKNTVTRPEKVPDLVEMTLRSNAAGNKSANKQQASE